MLMMNSIAVETRFNQMGEQWQEMADFVEDATQTGKAAHEVERGLWKSLLRMGFGMMEAYFEMSGQGDEGERLRLDDGREVKRLEARPRIYQSIFGRHEIERFVYGQREGRKLEAIPLDARLGLPEEKASYLLQEWNESLMLEVPYGTARELLEQILGAQQSMQTMERNQEKLSESVEAFWEQLPPPPEMPAGAILVNSVDCKGVCMRASETDGESGKKKMSILGSVYGIAPYIRTPEEVLEALFKGSKDPSDKSPLKRPKPLHKYVRACLKRDVAGTTAPQTAEVFDWIAQENAHRDPHQKHPTVILMDGQESLWSTARQAIPGDEVTEILDILHVSGYIWEAANLFHPDAPDDARAFAKTQLGRVLHGEVCAVVNTFRSLAITQRLTGKRRNEIDRICGYLSENSHRMAYDAYLAEGFPIATGVIEGACRCLVKDRMERSGMRWVMRGAQAMLSLRSISLSGLWESFMEFHTSREMNRLYGTKAANDDEVRMTIAA